MTNGAATATAGATAIGAKAKPPKPKREYQRTGIVFFEWLTDNAPFKLFILLCIIVNSIMLGYDANYGFNHPMHNQIEEWNTYFLWIFTAELVLEFLAQGPKRYVRDGWNLFDVIIVATGYAAIIPGVTALRTLRVLRVFRLVSNVPQMRRVVEALTGALPGIFATILVLGVVFYIGAVMSTTLFRTEDGFHDLGESALTLMGLSVFDNWGDTIHRIDQHYPNGWIFLVTFTVISAFAVLNLFIGVIVDAVQHTRFGMGAEIKREVKEIEKDVTEIEKDVTQIEAGVSDIAEAQEDAATVQRHILEEMRSLRAELAALKAAQGSAPPA